MSNIREVFGTAFLENGEWVIRYVTGEGAKVPIVANAHVKSELVDGAMVRLEGYLSSDGGDRVVGAIASDVQIISGIFSYRTDIAPGLSPRTHSSVQPGVGA